MLANMGAGRRRRRRRRRFEGRARRRGRRLSFGAVVVGNRHFGGLQVGMYKWLIVSEESEGAEKGSKVGVCA